MADSDNAPSNLACEPIFKISVVISLETTRPVLSTSKIVLPNLSFTLIISKDEPSPVVDVGIFTSITVPTNSSLFGLNFNNLPSKLSVSICNDLTFI